MIWTRLRKSDVRILRTQQINNFLAHYEFKMAVMQLTNTLRVVESTEQITQSPGGK